MANPFGDEAVPGSALTNPFGDEPAEKPRSFLGASVQAGLQGLKGAVATIADTLNPYTTSEADMAELYKNDPVALKKYQDESYAATLQRVAKASSARSDEIMGNLTPEGTDLAKKEYATLDPSKAAYLSPTRVAGDAMQSLPSNIAMGASMYLTRGAGATARAQALAAGMTEAQATAAAMKAGGAAMSASSAASEGVLGAAQQYNQSLSEADKVTDAQLQQSPRYRALLAQGYDPVVARTLLSQQTARSAGLGAGAADAAVNAVGGQVMGRIITGGKSLAARVAGGFAEEATTEGIQSPLEQISGNLAAKANLNPFQDTLAGAGEAMVAGAVVGGATGGVMAGVGGAHSKNVSEHASALDAAAKSKEIQAATGMTPEEAKVATVASGAAAAKPHLTAQQSQITIAANAAGIDPALALTVAQIESGNRSDAKNPKSSAHGLFQMLDSTWESVGGGDRNDPATQIRNGVTYVAQVSRQLENSLGRTPDSSDVYMGHLFGPGGASAIIKASQSDPQGNLIDTIRKYDSKNADAIVNNNGLSGLTNEQAYAKISGRVQQAGSRLGLNTAVNEQVNASKEADSAPITNPNTDVKMIEELDAMLAQDEMTPLTQEEEAQARAETSATQESVAAHGPEHTALVEQIDSKTPTEVSNEIPLAPPMLPRELQGATPRFGFGAKALFNISFADDLDKAAYIIASASRTSKADGRYLDFVMQNTGMTEDEARAYGMKVKEQIRAAAKVANHAENSTLTIPAQVGEGTARPDSYASMDEMATRTKYTNPNDHIKVTDTPISDSTNPDSVGLTLKEYPVQPGDVVALNTPSAQNPERYVSAVHDFLAQMTQRFMPNAAVLATFRTLDNGMVAGYQKTNRKGLTKKGVMSVHNIAVRNATNFGVTDDGSRNSTTQIKIAYSLAHEFGHALTEEQFKEGLSPEMVAKFDNLGAEEFFTPQDLASMPARTAAVLSEYNALKQRVLTDPRYTARNFVQDWLSPWKAAHGLQGANTEFIGAVSFAKKYLGESAATQINDQAKTFAMKMNADTDILSPHEYMAEQFARYAYSKKLLENSSLGTKEFFEAAFVKLRDYFKSIKGQGIVKPGIEFSKWVDSLTRAAQSQGTNEALPAKVEAKPRAKPAPKPNAVAAQATAAQVAQAPVVQEAATTRVETINMSGRTASVTRTSNGQYYEVDFAGIPMGGPLGNTLKAAQTLLVTQDHVAVQAERTQARQLQQATKPSVLPPTRERTDQVALVIGEKSEDQKLAETILRQDPMMKELRVQDPAAHKELSDLVKQGKLDEFKYEAQQYLEDATIDKMRWDTDNPEHMEMRNIEQSIGNTLPERTGVKAWLGHGLRKLSDAKYYALTLTQMAYANPTVAGLQVLDSAKNGFKTFKSRLEFKAVEHAQQWSKLGKEQAGLLEQAMRAEYKSGQHVFDTQVVNGTFRFVPNEQTKEFATKYKLDEATAKLWLDVKNSHISHMNALQNVLRRKLMERMGDKPMSLKKKLVELNQMFEQIRSTPFLPQTQFGEFAVKIQESTPLGNNVVHVKFFENAAARDEGVREMRKGLPANAKLLPANYSLTSSIVRTLPVQLLSTYSEELELTPKQRMEVRELADIITRNPQTRKYSPQLAKLVEPNTSLLRSYADFMSHDSSTIAKLFYKDEFNKATRMIKEDVQQAEGEQDFAAHDELVKILRFAEGYKQHMLDPAAEFHMIRSFVVMKLLWGNIKTAVANANSLVNLYALAARQQGVIPGLASSGKQTLRALQSSVINVSNRIMRSPVEGGQVFSPNERWALDQAKINGLLDETFAAQLASFANSSVLTRLNMSKTDAMFRQVMWVGMLPQHAVENFTRRVTVLTQFNNYSKQGMTKEEAFRRTQQDLYLQQGDTSKANRPAFMRGKASTFLIFYGYMQNMAYLMSGAQERSRNYRNAIESGKIGDLTTAQAKKKFAKVDLGGETLKMWMGYMLLGGLMGAPGADDLDKILGLVASKVFGKQFSLKEYAYKLASTIAEGASAMGVDINPRSIVHGTTSDINMLGMLPGMDMSSSIGLGGVLPGMGGVDKLGSKGGAGDFVINAMGPFGSIFKDLNKAFSDDPSMLNKMSLVMPNTLTGWAKAYKEHMEGVTYASGGKVTFDRETGQLRDLTTGETLTRLLGFQPSIVTSNKELHWMQKDKADFWTSRRNSLTAQMWEAQRQHDQEAIADVKKAIADFNADADPKLRLTSKEVAQSMQKHREIMKRDESRTAAAKRYKEMYHEEEAMFRGNVGGR